MKFKIEELIADYINYTEGVPKGLNNILQYIQSNDPDSIIRQIIFFSEGLEWLNQVSTYLKIKNVFVSFDLLEIEEHLIAMTDAAIKKDYIMLSDIIEYELIPYFENLKVEN